jgi:tetratricopeptide (TPR) repeat protein
MPTLSALSSALMDASQPEEALQVARRAVDIEPASPTALSALEYALLDVQQTARAIETFERALASDPENVDLFAGLAVRSVPMVSIRRLRDGSKKCSPKTRTTRIGTLGSRNGSGVRDKQHTSIDHIRRKWERLPVRIRVTVLNLSIRN